MSKGEEVGIARHVSQTVCVGPPWPRGGSLLLFGRLRILFLFIKNKQ